MVMRFVLWPCRCATQRRRALIGRFCRRTTWFLTALGSMVVCCMIFHKTSVMDRQDRPSDVSGSPHSPADENVIQVPDRQLVAPAAENSFPLPYGDSRVNSPEASQGLSQQATAGEEDLMFLQQAVPPPQSDDLEGQVLDSLDFAETDDSNSENNNSENDGQPDLGAGDSRLAAQLFNEMEQQAFTGPSPRQGQGQGNGHRHFPPQSYPFKQHQPEDFLPLDSQTHQRGQTNNLRMFNVNASHKARPLTSELQERLHPMDEHRFADNSDPQTKKTDSSKASQEGDGLSDSESRSWEDVQSRRQRDMRDHCSLTKTWSKEPPPFLPMSMSSIVVRHRNFLYCPVEKSASTFMRRFTYSLIHAKKDSPRIISPFEVPINSALSFRFESLQSLRVHGLGFLTPSKIRFIVAREPYSRLFSAYVDKLLVPNSHYWKSWGLPIVSHRKSASKRSLQCGHDVTFPEFVEYVTRHVYSDDNHVKPVSGVCAPCDAKFTIIGHLETLTSDFEYLTSQLNVTVTNFSSEDLATKLSYDAIQDSAMSAFRFYDKLKSCVSKYDMCERLWRKLQLRGIIDEGISFPLTQHEATMITFEEFFQVLLKAWKSSNDKQKLRAQKFRALKSAFAEVPPSSISKLVSMYKSDFEMFGYEKYPSFISRPTE